MLPDAVLPPEVVQKACFVTTHLVVAPDAGNDAA